MGDDNPSWVWFLDQDIVENQLRTDHPVEGMASRAAAHPAVVEAVRRHISGDPEGAFQSLGPALALDNTDALWLAGQFCYERNRFAEAAGYYSRLATRQPGHPYASLNQGIALGRNGDYAGALEALQRAVVLDPSRPQAWFVLGVCLLHSRRGAEARAAFRHSLELRPGYAPAMFGEASALQMEGRPAETLAVYASLLDHLGEASEGRSAEVEAVLENALAAATSCHDPAARGYAEQLHKRRPTSTAALAALAVAALNEQDHRAATQWLAALAEARPDSFEDWFNLAVALSHGGEWPRAAEAFETALQLRREDPNALEGAVRAWAEQGEWAKAESYCERLAGADPLRATAWFELGWLRMQRPHGAEEAARAADAFRQAAAIEPAWVEAWCNLGACRYESRQMEAAREAYEAALAHDPTRAAALHGLALLALDGGNIPQALEYYRASGSPHLELAFGFGQYYQEQQKPAEARQHYQTAVLCDPQCARAQWNLGHVLFALGEREEAQQCWRKALQLEPGLVEEVVG